MRIRALHCKVLFMNTYSATPNPLRASDEHGADATALAARQAPAARSILQGAIVLGIVADALFHDSGPVGLALPLWVALLALTMVSLAWTAERPLPREATGWLLSAILFAGAQAWRDSDALQFFDFLAVLLSLGMAAITVNDVRVGLLARRLRDTAWAWFALALDVMFGILPVAFREAFPPEARQPGRASSVKMTIRALAIAAPLAVVFGSLLISADPVFASLLPKFNLEVALSHIFVA
ncbi:MAG TPA: DUF4153 domain-containing protein, partial [Gemmatimonadaceae bacterium]